MSHISEASDYEKDTQNASFLLTGFSSWYRSKTKKIPKTF
jgi:hypothetical protein